MRDCVTHFHACDCREEKFKNLDKENIELHQTVAEQWTEIQKLKDEIRIATEAIDNMVEYIVKRESEKWKHTAYKQKEKRLLRVM